MQRESRVKRKKTAPLRVHTDCGQAQSAGAIARDLCTRVGTSLADLKPKRDCDGAAGGPQDRLGSFEEVVRGVDDHALQSSLVDPV